MVSDNNDDLACILTEEVIADMADNFFGSRKQLEDTIALFYQYIEALQQKAETVRTKAAFLNWLLTGTSSSEAGDFYRAIQAEIFAAVPPVFSEECIPENFPVAFTLKGRYIGMAEEAYRALKRSCDEYMNGGDHFREQPEEAYYRLVCHMAEMINADICKINAECKPSQVLQSFKQFSAENEAKEYVTGSASFYGDSSSMNRKLAFSEIDFKALPIETFPELPSPGAVESRLAGWCKKVYSRNPEAVRAIMADIEERYRERSEAP